MQIPEYSLRAIVSAVVTVGFVQFVAANHQAEDNAAAITGALANGVSSEAALPLHNKDHNSGLVLEHSDDHHEETINSESLHSAVHKLTLEEHHDESARQLFPLGRPVSQLQSIQTTLTHVTEEGHADGSSHHISQHAGAVSHSNGATEKYQQGGHPHTDTNNHAQKKHSHPHSTHANNHHHNSPHTHQTHRKEYHPHSTHTDSDPNESPHPQQAHHHTASHPHNMHTGSHHENPHQPHHRDQTHHKDLHIHPHAGNPHSKPNHQAHHQHKNTHPHPLHHNNNGASHVNHHVVHEKHHNHNHHQHHPHPHPHSHQHGPVLGHGNHHTHQQHNGSHHSQDHHHGEGQSSHRELHHSAMNQRQLTKLQQALLAHHPNHHVAHANGNAGTETNSVSGHIANNNQHSVQSSGPISVGGQVLGSPVHTAAAVPEHPGVDLVNSNTVQEHAATETYTVAEATSHVVSTDQPQVAAGGHSSTLVAAVVAAHNAMANPAEPQHLFPAASLS